MPDLTKWFLGPLVAVVVALGGYTLYAYNKIGSLKAENWVLQGQVLGLESLGKAVQVIIQSEAKVTDHERTVAVKVEAAPDSNSCANSPSLGIVLDDFRLHDAEGNPRTK